MSHQHLIDEDGEVWVIPKLQFKEDQWDLIIACINTVKQQAEDDTLTDSKCIEFMAAEYAASYGVESAESDSKHKKSDAAVEKNEEKKREERSNAIYVFQISGGQYVAANIHKGTSYLVNKIGGMWGCNCADYQYRRRKCKHIIAAENLKDQIMYEHN